MHLYGARAWRISADLGLVLSIPASLELFATAFPAASFYVQGINIDAVVSERCSEIF